MNEFLVTKSIWVLPRSIYMTILGGNIQGFCLELIDFCGLYDFVSPIFVFVIQSIILSSHQKRGIQFATQKMTTN